MTKDQINWRRRLAIAHQIVDHLLAGQRLVIHETETGCEIFAPCSDGISHLVYGLDPHIGIYQVQYRMVGADVPPLDSR